LDFTNSTMEIPSENSLSVDIDGDHDQSHKQLLADIQQRQKRVALIRQLNCTIYIPEKEFSVQHPLYSFILNTPTLEQVNFDNRNWKGNDVPIDALIDAVCQNKSIHTVNFRWMHFSDVVAQKLMEQKIRWNVEDCHFTSTGDPSSCNKATSICYLEELDLRINKNDMSFVVFMMNFQSWPLLRRLSIAEKTDIPLDWQKLVHLLEHVIRGSPNLQEMTLRYFLFRDPTMLQSVAAMIVGNNAASSSSSSAPDLKWHFDYCKFHPDTNVVWEKIVKSEKAKSMRVSLRLDKDHCGLLQTLMSNSSCLGDLDINDEGGDLHNIPYGNFFHMLPLLQEQPSPSAYPRTSIILNSHMYVSERYQEVIDSIPHWACHVKNLFLEFIFYGSASRPLVRTKLIKAVRNNLHLQLVEVQFRDKKGDNIIREEKADEECRAWLERYCERNRKLQRLDNADTIPLPVWPYVYHLASRGGVDMLYRHLLENAGYMWNDRHNRCRRSLPRNWNKMLIRIAAAFTRQSHDAAAVERKRKRA